MVISNKTATQGQVFVAVTYRDSGQQPFRHICNNDTNQENDRSQQWIAKDIGQDEKCHAKCNSHTSDDVDEVLNLNSDWSFAASQTTGQAGDSAHDRVVPGLNDDSSACALYCIGGEEGQVAGFQWVFMGEIGASALRL